MNPRLLVSVRSEVEAAEALAGGASLIDIKEPSRGSMGRADAEVIEGILRTVANLRPVSAAMGELCGPPCLHRVPAGLAFVKWGMAGALGDHWQKRLTAFSEGQPQIVLAAYADADAARAPAVEDVAEFACEEGWGLLIDTFDKRTNDGRPATLLDLLPLERLARLCERCRHAGVPIALAGSLSAAEIRRLLPLNPDWIGVRGAVCVNRDRNQSVSAEKVRELVALLTPATCEG